MLDYTEYIGRPGMWLDNANRSKLRETIAEWSSPDRLKLFDVDLDEWLADASEWDAAALDAAFKRYTDRRPT